jgi:hypothetical protein
MAQSRRSRKSGGTSATSLDGQSQAAQYADSFLPPIRLTDKTGCIFPFEKI